MNLLLYAPQMAAYGGMERHLCLVAEAAAHAGHDTALLTTSNSLAPEWRERLRAAGVELREMPAARGSAGGVAKAWWLFRQALALRGGRWDALYTNGQGALARIVWLAARSGTRCIHHHHTAADDAEQQSWTPGFRRVLAGAGELVGCSRFTAARLDAATGRSDSRFLPYLTETAFAAAAPAPATTTTLRFGFLGRLVPTKGLDTILRLAEDPACDGIEWHIHGAGPDYPPERFAGRPHLTYHGGYSCPAQQAAALAALDAVALFSIHNEGMPLSLIETMAAGLPWVASARGGTPELAESAANCELVQHPENYEECRAAVLRLAARLHDGQTSRAAQRAVWERRFAPAVVRAQWLEFLEGNETMRE